RAHRLETPLHAANGEASLERCVEALDEDPDDVRYRSTNRGSDRGRKDLTVELGRSPGDPVHSARDGRLERYRQVLLSLVRRARDRFGKDVGHASRVDAWAAFQTRDACPFGPDEDVPQLLERLRTILGQRAPSNAAPSGRWFTAE